MQKGKLLIFSAPSGSGKTTIVKRLLQQNNHLSFSISACTRPKRDNEIPGVDYYFMTPEEFRQNIANQSFVEWEEVYKDSYYGTLKSEIQRIWNEGKHVIFDVDVKGGLKIKDHYKEQAKAVFVGVPSIEILENRLRSRGTETEESLKKRLDKFKYEMTFQDKFDIILVNDQLEIAITQAQAIFEQHIKAQK